MSCIVRQSIANVNGILTLISTQGQTMDEDSLLRKVLGGELHYAKLWLVCVALRGVSWDNMPFEQRELAFQAKNAAFNCLTIFLTSSAYRCDRYPSPSPPLF